MSLQNPNAKNVKVGDLLKSITIDQNNLLDPKCHRNFMTLLSLIGQDPSFFRTMLIYSELVKHPDASIVFRVAISDKIYFYTNLDVDKIEDLFDRVYEYILRKTVSLDKLINVEIPVLE
jgi:hypothetical protein